jgi:acetyl esterase/lipase
MRRWSVIVLALVLTTVMTGGIPLQGAAHEVASPTAGAKPHPPSQPATGPGGSEVRFRGMTTTEQIPPGEVVADYWLFVPSDPLPETTATEPLPLVIFAHSYTMRDPAYYLAWIEHLVKRGAVVLHTEFQEDSEDYAVYRQNLLDDVRGALATLETEGVPIDPGRVAVVGHSVGGVLAVDYAASAAAEDLPVPAVVMAAAPGCECQVAGLDAVPATTRVVLVVAADDSDPTGGGMVAQLWNGLSAVPLEQRDIVTVVSDTHGAPWLLATHEQAEAASPDAAAYTSIAPDALDWYGTWKWLDALMGCAFAGEWCEYALGNTPEQRFMGTWSDGAPVAEALISDTAE